MAQASDLAAYCLAQKFFDVSTAHDATTDQAVISYGPVDLRSAAILTARVIRSLLHPSFARSHDTIDQRPKIVWELPRK
jgi:hypothetical protein